MGHNERQTGVVVRLGVTQTLAWASSYYLPALLAEPLAVDLGVSPANVFGAFTLALVISALMGPWAGRAIDVHGGRAVLPGTNVLFVVGLLALGFSTQAWHVWLAWATIGLAMGSGLYEAAFATVVRLYHHNARSAITGITLIAGFASTVGWPLTAIFLDLWGWRSACWFWAALHLLVCIPLHLQLPRQSVQATGAAVVPNEGDTASVRSAPQVPGVDRVRSSVAWLMSGVFAITWFMSTAMAAHLPKLLETQGLASHTAVAVAMLVGPAQVAGRLLEFNFLRHLHPLLSAKLAAAAHPLGALLLAMAGPAGAWLFAAMHGAGNGILTIAKGTLPMVVFGPAGYGARQGWLMAPARLAQAAAPLLFGMVMEQWGAQALWVSGLLGVASVLMLLWMGLQIDKATAQKL